MRRPNGYRLLNFREKLLCHNVFQGTLPPWQKIGIGDGLGMGDRPWTDTVSSGASSDHPEIRYAINVGDYAYEDLNLRKWTEYGLLCDLLVHEMTHVWQYFHGVGVKVGSAWANTLGAGYEFEAGDPWDEYNVEQQAAIVEKWHHRGSTKRDQLYPYMSEVIWSHGDARRRKLTLAELTALLIIPGEPNIPSVIHMPSLDPVLVPILEKRYAANDVAGFGGRVKRLEKLFGELDWTQAQALHGRLASRRNGDKVSMYFYDRLSSATRTHLLKTLQTAARPIRA
jgi:hypothetical protein